MSHLGVRGSLEMPETFNSTHHIEGPKKMVIVGEATEARTVTEVNKFLGDLALWREDIWFHAAGTELFALALPYVNPRAATRITDEQPKRLAQGYGLQVSQATEALFVSPNIGKIRPESILWLGRAIGARHVERVYFLDPSGECEAINHIDGLAEELEVIQNPVDVFRLVSNDGVSEIRYSDAHKVASASPGARA